MHISRLLSELLSPSYRARRWYLRHIYPGIAPELTHVRMNDGTVLHVRPRHDYVQREIFLHSGGLGYESHIATWMRRNMHPGMVVLEIGAHIGYYAGVICRGIRPGGKAIFVEPLPQHFQLLEGNLKVNTFENGIAVNVALSDRSGMLALYPATDGGRNSLALSGISDLDPIIVKSLTLDDLLAECRIDHVDIMQIDIEGAECLVLSAAQRALVEQRVACILCEFHPVQVRQDFGREPLEFVEGVCGLGYSASRLDPETGVEKPFDRAAAGEYQHLIFRSNRL